MSLYSLKGKEKCIIEKLPEIALLKSLGLREGMVVNIVTRQPLGGPIVIQMGKRSVALAKGVAEQITVREAS